MTVQLYLGDCLEIMRGFTEASIDAVVTDPPYESLNKWREMGTTARLGGHRLAEKRDESKWFKTICNDDLPDFIQECYRVLKPDTHCYIMCDYETLPFIHQFAVVAGVFQHIAPLIWDKGVNGMGYHYRRSFEFVMMLDKGKNRRLNNLSTRDVLQFRQPLGAEKLMPTQKPVDLMKLLIEQSSREGEVVLDPFMGSGTTGLAAVALGRRFIGIEIDPHWYSVAEKRIREAEMQPMLEGLT